MTQQPNTPFPPAQPQEQQQQPTFYPTEEEQNMSINDLQSNATERDKIPPKLRKFMEMDNIAESLSDEELDEICTKVKDGYEYDKQSRSQWDENLEEAFRLVSPNIEEKNIPWPKAASIKYPLITGACIQFNARTVPEIIRDGRVVEIKLIGSDDPQESQRDRADRLSEHMSYQLLKQSKNWKTDTDKLLMMLPMVGTMFRKSYFDPIKGMPVTELCLPEDIMVNNNITSLSQAPRITHKKPLTSNMIIELQRAGLFLECDLKKLDVSQGDDLTENEGAQDDNEYKGRHADERHEALEQDMYLDLDDDGYKEPYTVTIHNQANKVFRIVALYDENSFEFSDKGEMIKINPIEHFTDYHFLPNPDGSFYSLGFGVLLTHISGTINSTLNQLLDAGVLANRQSGFISKSIRVLKGDYNFKPGEWKLVAGSPGEPISQGITPLPVKEPSQVLFQLMSFLIESAKQITSISEVMQGEVPAGNTPVGTTMAVIEQSQKVYSAILERLYTALQSEFEKLYDMNRKYLNIEETIPMAMKKGVISLSDYKEPNYGIYPVADPKISSSTQRLLQAQAILQVADNPLIDKREAMKRYLEALRINNIDLLMPPPPPNPQPTPQELMEQAELAEIQAKTSKIRVDTAAVIMSEEDKARNTTIAEGQLEVNDVEVKSKTAFFAGELASKKIDSISTLSQLEQIVPQQDIQKALTEEEAITQQTELQDTPVDVYQRIDELEQMMKNLALHQQQQILDGGSQESPQGGEQPQQPPQGEQEPEGAPQEAPQQQ